MIACNMWMPSIKYTRLENVVSLLIDSALWINKYNKRKENYADTRPHSREMSQENVHRKKRRVSAKKNPLREKQVPGFEFQSWILFTR